MSSFIPCLRSNILRSTTAIRSTSLSLNKIHTTTAVSDYHAPTSSSSLDAPGRPRLQGKVAVITGAGAGIGRASAILFAEHGARIAVVDRSAPAGQGVVDEINAKRKDSAIFIQADVSKASEIKSMIEKTAKEFGGLHVLFNNAGIQHLEDDNAETTEEKIWDLTFNINVKGVWFGCKYALPYIRKSGGGSIINVASFVAKIGAATPQLAYTSSKGAVLSMTKELAVVHARENIRVNALCPGPLRTKLLMDFLDTEEKKQRRLVHVPMGRFGEAEEVARAALFLASDESSYMTGTEFLVDGGITAAYVTPTGETKSLPPQ